MGFDVHLENVAVVRQAIEQGSCHPVRTAKLKNYVPLVSEVNEWFLTRGFT